MSLPESRQNRPENPEYKYPGTSSLVLIETALANYNEWVVGKFIRAFTRKTDANSRVLDFGSGVGTLSKIFYAKTGIRPDAFDLDPIHRAEITKIGFRTYADTAELPDNYDLVFTSNVLEHIQDDLGVLKTIRLHLRENGMLLIYVPAFEFLWTTMDDMVEHVRRYSEKELRTKLQEAGYKVEYTGYCDSIGFILSLLFKFIGREKREMPIRSLEIYDRFLLPISKLMDLVFSRFFGKNLYVIARKSA